MYYTPAMMAKTNDPIKQDSSVHAPVLVTNLIFWAGIAVSGAGSNNFLVAGAVAAIIVVSYLIYLIAVCCCSDMKGYINNLKAFDDYKKTYDGMVAGKGFFTFWIECYHYQTRTDHKGHTHTEKVVTHTATERFNPRICEDDSGNITGIKDITKYVFINYLKKFYFAD